MPSLTLPLCPQVLCSLPPPYFLPRVDSNDDDGAQRCCERERHSELLTVNLQSHMAAASASDDVSAVTVAVATVTPLETSAVDAMAVDARATDGAAEDRPSEAEGYRLHKSTGASGYYGVYKSGSGYMAQPSRNGKQAYLGTFPTAVEAAVAMAKYMQERGEDEDEDDGLPSESQGIELHKRRKLASGYLGVYKDKSRFQARLGHNGKQISLGQFDSAVDAAVAVARYMKERSTSEAVEEQVEHGEDLPSEAEGFTLRKSMGGSGYYGVKRNGPSFKAQIRHNGRQIYLGSFATNVEAAVAVARHLASAPSAASAPTAV